MPLLCGTLWGFPLAYVKLFDGLCPPIVYYGGGYGVNYGMDFVPRVRCRGMVGVCMMFGVV